MFNIKNKSLNIFLYKIYKNVRNSINKEKITILNSAGVDSKMLTNILILVINIKNLVIIHINHNISNIDKNCKKNLLYFNKKINFKLFIINLNKKKFFFIKEKKLRIKREKIIKIFNKKFKINSIWIAHHKNDKTETDFINYIYKNKNIKKNIYYKNIVYLIEKKKPFENIKKKFIKNKFLKNIKWIEEYSNLKKKNIRNILRIKILKNKRDVAERFKALPC